MVQSCGLLLYHTSVVLYVCMYISHYFSLAEHSPRQDVGPVCGS